MQEEIRLKPIGVIHSAYQQQNGTPIQPSLSGDSVGWVEVFPEFEEGLADLEGFERLWLIYRLARSTPDCLLRVKPYLDDREHGVFATRSPSRPNLLGLSCVRLNGREGRRLDITELDILDGSPLLDIKPYVPKFDSFAVERVGWFARTLPDEVRADDRFSK